MLGSGRRARYRRGLFTTFLLYEFHRILGAELRADPTRFGRIVRGDLERGSKISDQRYGETRARRPAALAQLRGAFRRVDALVTPMMPSAAVEPTAGPDVFARARQFTVPFSVAGLPSVSVPCGFSPAGPPVVGLLLMRCGRAASGRAPDGRAPRPP